VDIVETTLQQLYLAPVILDGYYKQCDVDNRTDDEQEYFTIGEYHIAFSFLFDAKLRNKTQATKKKCLQKCANL
jgi:hypothetical protein